MGARRDLKRARRRSDLSQRVRVDLVREQDVVREARTSALVPPATEGSVADIPFTNAAEAPEAVVLRRKEDGRWRPVTSAGFAREVTAVAAGLIAVGLPAGGRVALMSRTRYEWEVLDFAVWAAGGQTVPVYATSSADQIEWILRDADVRFLVTETDEHTRTARAAAQRLPHPVQSWQIDDGAVAELTRLGEGTEEAAVHARRGALGPQTVATVCYTSGTTGRPKGCVLTHGNLLAEAANTVELLHPVFEAATGQTASTLLFLPLAHILGRTLQIACLRARIELGHCPSIKPDELRPELKSFRPTFLVGVPYLFEKIHDTGRATAEKIGRGASFDRADNIAVRYGEASLRRLLGTGPGPGLPLGLAAALYDLLVYRRVRKELGGRMRYAISGGSPLDRRLSLFFWACGIVVYEGYGLTETTAAASVNHDDALRIGTVGR
ncbi:MAG TPA: AMP-binding protein, partial [Streptomyces sp.]|nr:AMP-binding protein [Streptomyces sp.]